MPGCIYINFEVFDVGDYEKCSLLGYKNPVRTLEETYCFSATELIRLMLRKV
jgi:hypothetical protein